MVEASTSGPIYHVAMLATLSGYIIRPKKLRIAGTANLAGKNTSFVGSNEEGNFSDFLLCMPHHQPRSQG